MDDLRPKRFRQYPRSQQQSGATLPQPVAPLSSAPAQSSSPVEVPDKLLSELSKDDNAGLSVTPPPKRPWWKRTLVWGIVVMLVLIGLVAAAYGWYQSQLEPLEPNATSQKTIAIEQGASPQTIGKQLENETLIKSGVAFEWYVRLSGASASLQAGKHVLSPSMDVDEIVQQLSSAEPQEITLTFLPGATVADNKKVLRTAGYSDQEIDQAFDTQYDHPVFQDKPESADLEGYIYGETYNFAADATVEQILTRTFDELYAVIEKNDLVAKYEAQDLTLFQGIILASIIQRESGGNDKEQIAQVFLSRLRIGMNLGSDVTYQYIADKLGVARDTNLDNPYNTRRYEGLPPGPIAAPGLDSLRAVGAPASGDYLFFLSGDDDVTYFARTQAEHEANIRDHCQEKCQII